MWTRLCKSPNYLQRQLLRSTPQSLNLTIFGQPIELKIYSAHMHDTYQHMYQRFINQTHSIPTQQSLAVISEQSNKDYQHTSNQLSIFDVSRLLRTYVTQIRTHLLIHAGVLSFAKQGILLVAPSMHGKTTLTLKLLRDGFDFLSDDIAALSLIDNLVHPFPRAFVIRPGSLAMAGFSPLPSDTPSWFGKQVVDAETLRANCIGQPVPIRHVFFLNDGNIQSEKNSDNDSNIRSFEIILKTLPADLESKLTAISGIKQITIGATQDMVRLAIDAKNRLYAMQEVEMLCQDHSVEILFLDERAWQKPSFTEKAKLTKISNSTAVVHLLDQFLGGYHSALFQNEMNNSPIQLSMTLARIIQNAECHMLRVGPLEDMASLVKETVYATA